MKHAKNHDVVRISHRGNPMLNAVEGIFRDGKVELLEVPTGVHESRVIVTFVPPAIELDLSSRGIDETQAAELRARLRTFAEDWDRPEMNVYDEPATR